MMLLRMLTKQTVVSADRCSSACSRMVFQWLACAVGMPGGRALREGCGGVAGAKDPNAVEGSIVLLADPPHHGDAETAECPLWVKSRHLSVRQRCPLYPRKRTCDQARMTSAKCQKRTSPCVNTGPYAVCQASVHGERDTPLLWRTLDGRVDEKKIG